MIGIACIFKRLERKSNRYDRYLAFLFFLSFFFVSLCWNFSFFAKSQHHVFIVKHRTFPCSSASLLQKKTLNSILRASKQVSVCVRLVTKFYTYINSHSCNSRRNPFITSRWPDKNSFQKYFRFLSFFFYSRRPQHWLFSFFFSWVSCEPFAELFPKSASSSISFYSLPVSNNVSPSKWFFYQQMHTRTHQNNNNGRKKVNLCEL